MVSNMMQPFTNDHVRVEEDVISPDYFDKIDELPLSSIRDFPCDFHQSTCTTLKDTHGIQPVSMERIEEFENSYDQISHQDFNQVNNQDKLYEIMTFDIFSDKQKYLGLDQEDRSSVMEQSTRSVAIQNSMQVSVEQKDTESADDQILKVEEKISSAESL